MMATADKSYFKTSSAAVLGILLSLLGMDAKASTAVPTQGDTAERTADDSSTDQDAIASTSVDQPAAESPAVSQLMPSDEAQTFNSLLPAAQFSAVVSPPSTETVASTPTIPAAEATSNAQSLLPQLETTQPEIAQLETVQLEAAQLEMTSLETAQSVDDTFSPLSDDEVRQQLLIDPTIEQADIRSGDALGRPRPVPSSNFLTPSAYGADWGDAYIGIAGATVDNDREFDGSASVGIGLGSAVENVGVEVSVDIISLEGFAEDGIAGAKLHKVFPRLNNLAVAVGWSNPIKWGDAQDDEDTFYGVVTQQYPLRAGKPNPMPVTASLGVGTGAFRSTGAIEADDNAPNVFGSVGLRVIPEVSAVTSWTGSALGLALSTAPFETPLVFTLGVADLTDNTDRGTQFVGSVGYSFGF